MWTPTTRQQHSRTVMRYQTDLTDAEWRVIAPHLPVPRAMGRPREWPMREIVNGIFYVMRAGCPWRLLPNDLPPWGTIYRWFAAWRDDGRLERIPLIELAECGNLSKLLNERSRLLVPYLTTTMTTTFLASLRMSWTDF